MTQYTTTVEMGASPESVWEILTDGPGYANWNPEINRVDGKIALGEKVKAHIVLHGGKVQPVTVRVTELEPIHRMVWRGGLPLGLFTGLRTFSLVQRDGGVDAARKPIVNTKAKARYFIPKLPRVRTTGICLT